MLANSDCTVYLFDKQTGGFVRKYAEKVYWCENRSGSIVKSGMQTSDSTRVYFYDDNAPKTPAEENVSLSSIIKRRRAYLRA